MSNVQFFRPFFKGLNPFILDTVHRLMLIISQLLEKWACFRLRIEMD